jgi:hypothetical protein
METVPGGGTITYFLWSLLFLKVYGSTEVLLKVAGNPDAKTFRKWVWQFIYAIGNLQPVLVSSMTKEANTRVFANKSFFLNAYFYPHQLLTHNDAACFTT